MRRYLIVDDNDAFSDNLAEILRELGSEVDVVGTGREALALVALHRYHALITDMRMPTMSGAELVHRVRQLDTGLPAIVVTAYTHDDELAAARREGLLAVLQKPVPVSLVLELLRSARRDGLLAIVEQDVALLDSLTEVLQARGFSAVTASTLVETSRFGVARPFAALVDLHVQGGEDGVAMVALARKYPGLPMLVMTAENEEAPSGCLDVFRKPFETGTVVRAVERLYETQHA